MDPPANKPDGELPLSPAAFHILLSLVNTERHGYGIMQEVEARTDGRMHIVSGTLYGAIRRLLAKGIIEECGERPDPALNDERRRYYRLTDYGLEVITAEAERLARLVRQAQDKQLLGAFGLPQLSGLSDWTVLSGIH
jgi:DNA-binding PadR family transcriptional regulator